MTLNIVQRIGALCAVFCFFSIGCCAQESHDHQNLFLSGKIVQCLSAVVIDMKHRSRANLSEHRFSISEKDKDVEINVLPLSLYAKGDSLRYICRKEDGKILECNMGR